MHDLLTRHLRGIRDGRGDDFTTRAFLPTMPIRRQRRDSPQHRSPQPQLARVQLRRRRPRCGTGRGRVVDGLLIALSDGLDRIAADRLSAVAAGLHSIAKGASVPLNGGTVHEVIVEFEQAILFVMSISDASVLAVYAKRPCDVGLVGYEMAVLVERCASALTPDAGRRAPDRAAAVT